MKNKAISLSQKIIEIQNDKDMTPLNKLRNIYEYNMLLSKKFKMNMIQKYFEGWKKEEYEDQYGCIWTFKRKGYEIQTSGQEFRAYKVGQLHNEQIHSKFVTVDRFIQDCKRAGIQLIFKEE